MSEKSFLGRVTSVFSKKGEKVEAKSENTPESDEKFLEKLDLPEPRLLFYRGEFRIFEDRFESRKRKVYFSDVKVLKLERRAVSASSLTSFVGRAALQALNGAQQGGVVGAIAGGVSGALGVDDEKKEDGETHYIYCVGFPERADLDDYLFETASEAEAREVAQAALNALRNRGVSPDCWQNGKLVKSGK